MHDQTGLDALSPREGQILELASRGLTNAQIGEGLHVTTHAVKFHLAGVYRKLAVKNRTQAVGVFLRAMARTEDLST